MYKPKNVSLHNSSILPICIRRSKMHWGLRFNAGEEEIKVWERLTGMTT
jgi:hypothetical protein